MYCRNCGNSMEVSQPVCQRCGSDRGAGNSFCPACGQRHDRDAENCPACGCGLVPAPNPGTRSRLAAGLLGILLGAFGVHNFYLGYHGKAWAQMTVTVLSVGTLIFVSGLWGLVEGILYLAGYHNTDAAGRPLRS